MAEAIKIAKAEEGRAVKITNPKDVPTDKGQEEEPDQLDKKKKKVPTCYSCGKKGHKSPECTVSEEEKAKYKAAYKKQQEAGLGAPTAPKNN